MQKVLLICLLLFGGWAAAQNIAAIEYFIDEQDPGVGNATDLTINGNSGELTQTFEIPTTGLSEGFHSLYVRSQTSNGDWSLYDRTVFFIAAISDVSQNIAAAEYFFDQDPGLGNGSSLALDANSGELTQTLVIPTTGLDQGIHSLYMRTQNTDGSWSLYDRTIFYVNVPSDENEPLIAAEYFFDTQDPGVGNGSSITLDANTGQLTQALALDTDGLAEGQHTVYIRVQTESGTWSLYDTATFTVDPNAIDNTVTLENEVLTANFEASGALYQWLDCNSGGTEIANATDQSYAPSATGSYAVRISFNGESVVSDCIEVIIVNSEEHFVTTWKTDNVEENDAMIEIPTVGEGYNYDVDWDNDGVFDEIGVNGNIAHDYGIPGTYTIRIRGDFPRIFIANNQEIRNKILSVDQWGVIEWQSMERAFQGAVYMVINATDTPDLSNVLNMRSIFQFAYSLNSNLNNWDVSNVSNMRFAFHSAISFNQPLSNWNVGNVTDMSYMFSNAPLFNQPLNDWNVSNVTNMQNMFSIVDFDDPFELIPPDEEDGLFDQNLSDWDVSNVTNMKSMFEGATSFNSEINQWNVSSVTDMSDMFRNALSFNQPIGNWNVSNVTDMSGMFSSSPGPIFGGGPEMQFNQPLNEWNVSNVTNLSNMFTLSENFNQPLNNWDVSNVTDFSFMFAEAESFDQPLNSWNVSSAIDIGGMFQGTLAFNQTLENWDVGNVTLMDALFNRANVFNQSLATWNVSNVTNMTNMFLGVKLSTSNYDETLMAWSMLTLQPDVTFSGGLSNYCEAEEERNVLINDYNWTIIDGGLDCTAFSLPTTNFTVKIVGESCIGNNDGAIELSAQEVLSYSAELSGQGVSQSFQFTETLTIPNLEAGNYRLCILVDGESDYEQCFDVSISEPEPLSASAKVDFDSKSVTLDLKGSESYTIQINDEIFRTDKSNVTLPLSKIENTIVVFGEKGCQGTFEKTVVLSDAIFAYPNPVVSEGLSIYMGSPNEFSTVKAQLFDLTGARILEKQIEVENGYIHINMNSLPQGTYILSLKNQAELFNQKIIKQ